jgi:SOS response regulatory protein OraA/RecX
LWLANRRARKTESPRQLLANLCGRGIPRKIAEAALKDSLDKDEKSLLKNFIQQKAPSEKPGTRLKQKLKQEGFSPQIIQTVLEEQT